VQRPRLRTVAGLIVSCLVASGLLAACGTPPPQAIAPTFEAWNAIGLSCDGPHRSNEPTTLVQWVCRGTVGGTSLTVVVDGDDHGIHDLVAQVAAAVPDSAAIASFRALVGASPYLTGAQEGADAWLQGLPDIRDDTTAISGENLHLVRDSMWVTLAIFSVP
jgi:hypothetical protein